MRKLKITVMVFLSVLLPSLLFAQGKTLTGRVTDAKSNPVAGVSITINQTNKGTVTDLDGRFTLTVPENATLAVSSTGFRTQVIKVSALTDIQVKLEEDFAKLDEVVVTGLATTVKRRNLANAVGTISSKELNGTAPAQTFDAALNGKITGAYINANSGAPGGGMSVKLRGVTSIFGNTQPLYVVDGVYVDNTAVSTGLNTVTGAVRDNSPVSTQDNASSRIADLRAEDIENIEILKGASAAAIYGSRAAAGVIIITTKRGKQGKTRFSVSQDLGFAKVRKLLGVRQFTPETAGSLSNNPATSAALTQQFNDAKAAGKLYDYEKEVYGNTGFLRNTTFSMTGGSDKTSFYFSAAQKDEGGIVKNTGYRNSSLRLNIDHKISDNIKVGISTNYVNSSADRGLTGNDNNGVSYSISLSSTPQFIELHPDEFGVYPSNPFAASNVLQTIALMRNNESVNRFSTGINLEAQLQRSEKSLTRFIARGGIDFYNNNSDAQFPRELQFQAVNKGTAVQGSTKNLNANYILSLVNTYTVGDNLSFNTSGGFTQETGDFNNILDVATQVAPGQTGVDQGGALSALQTRKRFENDGIFVQEEATIKDGIILTGGVRFDRSTNNGATTRKFIAYPKAGLAINLTRLGVVNDGFFNNLKLRGAYGQSANFPVYESRFTLLGASNVSGIQGSIVNTQGGDANIKPERQTELEAGIDFSVLNSKLNFELTFYNKKIFDFLLLRTVEPSSGFVTKWVNAGDLRNQGIELSMNAKPITTKNISWTSSVSFWLNRSKVTKLTIPPVVLGSFGNSLGTFQIEQGKSATQIVGNDAPNFPKGTQVVLGNQEPRFQMNTFNEVTLMNKFSLRFLIHWKYKGDNVNLTNLLNDFGATSADYDANGPTRIGGYLGGSARGFVQNSGYLRFREIGLYYTFSDLPVKFLRSVRAGVSLNNYFTITKYVSYDPEVSNFGTGFSTGVDVDPFPASKRAMFSLTIDF